MADYLNSGKNILKIVGPKAFPNFKKIFGDKVVGIFLKCKDCETMEKRLREKRTDISESDLQVRLKQANEDLSFEKFYDYSVINPEGHPEIAVAEIEKIIKSY